VLRGVSGDKASDLCGDGRGVEHWSALRWSTAKRILGHAARRNRRAGLRQPNPRGRPDRSQSLSPITAPEQYGRLWKAKSSHETCHLRLPLAASTEAAWACSASIRLISRRMRARLIRILSGLLLIRLAGLAVKGVCGRAISVPFPHAGQITRQCRLIGGCTLRAHASILGCEIPHEP